MKPWEKQRILEENALVKEYAYKNKKELWKTKSKVSRLRDFAKKLVSVSNAQQAKEKDEFIKAVHKKGLVQEKASVEDVLALNVRDMSERRLQTLVFKKGFAKTPKQARQFIVHGHVFVNNKKITSPSTVILKKEEDLIKLKGVSPVEEKK